MKKSIALTGLVLLSILLLSCSPGSVKSGLTPETVAEAYEESSYSTWCHTISGDDADAYKYKSELKVYDPDNESEDCVFVYFFGSAEEAEAYKKEQESKSGAIWFFLADFRQADGRKVRQIRLYGRGVLQKRRRREQEEYDRDFRGCGPGMNLLQLLFIRFPRSFRNDASGNGRTNADNEKSPGVTRRRDSQAAAQGR